MPKSRLRDSFLNMLGEFVALNKSPDFKLNSQSNQYLAEAIRDEIEHKKRMSNDSLFLSRNQVDVQPRHFRTTSTNSGYHGSAAAKGVTNSSGQTPQENDPYFLHGRRQSLPTGCPTTRQRLFQRLRRPSSRRQGSYEVAEEQEQQEKEANAAPFADQIAQLSRRSHKKRRTSMISESDETDSASEEKENGNTKKGTVHLDQAHHYSTNLKIR